MKVHYHKLIIALLFAISFCISNAQIPEAAKSMLSPNAAALGEYGEVPVSYFTGIPNIEIPIYTITCGPHSLPISLNYHAGGVRPDQRPGWVGLGWTLNAGGCISRIVKDKPDEFNISLSWDKCCTNAGFLYRFGLLDNDNWDNAWQMHSYCYEEKNRYISSLGVNIMECYYADWDTEPDEYSFNFMGYHGKFWLNHQGHWQVQCDRSVSVRLLGTDMDPYGSIESGGIPNSQTMTSAANGYSKAIEGFEIITEDGTCYVFGESNTAIEYSLDFFQQKKEDAYATTWYLRRIVYADGRSINFHYSPAYRPENFSKGVFTAQFGVSAKCMTSLFATDGTTEYGVSNTIDTSAIYQGVLIRPVYLTSITTDIDSVIFEKEFTQDLSYDLTKICKPYTRNEALEVSDFLPLLYENSCGAISGEKDGLPYPDKLTGTIEYCALKNMKLSSMSLYKKHSSDTIVKSWGFEYSEQKDQRLLLECVRELGNNNSYNKLYSFDYCSPEKLPKYLDNSTDHWGFYNHNPIIASDYSNGNLWQYYSKKEPAQENDSCRYYGTLTKITYPTGGYTNFYFEPNYFGNTINANRTVIPCPTNKLAGGLRIRKIETFDNISSLPSSIEYDYCLENSNVSSGLLATQQKYYFQNYGPRNLKTGQALSMDIFSTQSIIPGTENACGSHIGYSTVTERFSDGSRNVYRYTNYDSPMCGDLMAESVTQSSREECEPFSSRSQMRGLLLSKKEFDSDNRLLSTKTVSYELDDSSSHNYVRSFKYDITPYGNGTDYEKLMVEGASYRNFTYLPRIKTERIVTYETSDSSVVTTDYSYGSNKLPQTVVRQSCDNTIETKRMSYVSDDTATFVTFHNEHVLSPIVEQVVTKSSEGTTHVVTKQRNQYSGIPYPDSIFIANGSSDYELRKVYSYDSFHNPIEEVLDNGKHTVYLWGYNAKYIIAVIENASLAEVMYELGVNSIQALSQLENGTTPDFTAIDNLRNLLPYAMVSTYQYQPLIGVTQSIAPNGQKKTFGYDEFGRLQYVKDHSGNIIEAYNYHYKN